MAWYDVTYSCGHEGRVNIIGRVKDREWKVDREAEKLCPECWEAEKQRQFDEANKAAAAEATEMGLPELTGSEKQVSWANTLRQEWIEETNRYIDRAKDNIERYRDSNPEEVAKAEKELPIISDAIDRILLSKTDARYWIDSRYDSPQAEITKEAKMVEKEANDPTLEMEKRIDKENTLLPEGEEPNTIAMIKEDGETIRIESPKDKTLIEIVKELSYKWDKPAWGRKITKFNGPTKDRVAEVAHKLLSSGIGVTLRVNNVEEVKGKIISGDIAPEQKNWLVHRNGSLVVRWGGYSDTYYNGAKGIRGARWDDGMVIPVSNYKQALDFVNAYGFAISDGAEKAIDAYRKELDAAEKVNLKPLEESNSDPKDDPLVTVLESPSDVIEDLKDND